MDNQSVLVLFSGGLDSTALIHYYLQQNIKVQAVHFNYGQKSFFKENEAVQAIAKYFNINVDYCSFDFRINSSAEGEYACRNALFIISAASCLPKGVSRIALGIHYGSTYYDTSNIFMADCQRILDGYFNGTVTIEAPFLYYEKAQIYSYFKTSRLPLNLTYSCELGNDVPCGECYSCKDRMRLNEYYPV